MSMMYCHRHDRHYDTDHEEDCPECAEWAYDEATDEKLIDDNLKD